MNNTRSRVVLLAAAFSCILAVATAALAQPRPAASGNLYQALVSHKEIMWRPPATPIPQDVCNFFSACDDNKPAKFVTLPPATIDGHQVGRAVFWTHMKGKDAFILEHQTHAEAYFFLLAPDGSLSKTVYLESGKPFYLVANETGQSKFDKDKTDWNAWIVKSAAPEK